MLNRLEYAESWDHSLTFENKFLIQLLLKRKRNIWHMFSFDIRIDCNVIILEISSGLKKLSSILEIAKQKKKKTILQSIFDATTTNLFDTERFFIFTHNKFISCNRNGYFTKI